MKRAIMKLLTHQTFFIFFIFSITLSQNQVGSDIDGEAATDRFGSSISISANGTKLAVGAPLNDGNGSSSGHARVFEFSAGSWSQLGSDIDGEASGDRFGHTIAIDSDGNRVAIGGPLNDGNGSNSGHVKVFEYSGGTWSQLGSDIDGETSNDQSGYWQGLSINAAGTRVAVGAWQNDGGGSDAGHVRIYEYSGSSWSQLGSDIDGGGNNYNFGYSVSLDSDGSHVIIGGPNKGDKGQVEIYQYSGGSWSQVGSDIDNNTFYDGFGSSVDIDSDGDRIVVGAPQNNGYYTDPGYVRVFEYSGGSWTQLGSDIDGENGDDFFGSAVSINSDGDKIVVGAQNNDGTASNAGHVRVFAWNGSSWNKANSDIDGESGSDNFGYSVSMNSTGNIIASGAYGNDGTASNAGHVQVYSTFTVAISGNAGFRMLSSPVSGQVLGDLLTNSWTQGMTGADVTSGNTNVWTFNVSGQNWTALSDISGSGTSIAAGQGFLTYIYADNNFDGTDDLPITLSVSGSENSGSATYPASGSIAANAWGLAGNPYHSTIDWDNVTKTNVTSTAYVWDDATSAYKSWNGSSGGLTNGLIAPYQGFWMQANSSGSGSITIEDADKSSSAGTFYRIANIEKTGSLSLTFTATDSKQDIAWFSFSEDGKVHRDSKDAYKLLPFDATSRLVAMSYNDESSFDINNLPFLQDQAFEVFVDIMSLKVEESNFITMEEYITVSWDIDDLPIHTEVILIDQVTGTHINIRNLYSYTFTTQPKGAFSTNYSEPLGTYPIVGEARFSLRVSYDILNGGGNINVLPAKFALHAAYPNPFNPSTTISFDLPESEKVSLNVYDLKGVLVGTLLYENKVAGTYQYRWTPSSELTSGMYLFELKTKNKMKYQKITYIK